MLVELHQKHFKKVFRLMEDSFPRDEYRNFEAQKALLANPAYTIYGRLHEIQGVQAFAAVWHLDDFHFIEHIAVNPHFRNEGIGSEFLQEILHHVNGMVCLEVEPPETDIAHRRIGYYERAGFHLNHYPYMQPALQEGHNPVPLLLMTSGKAISKEQFEQIKKNLYEKVYEITEEA